MGGGVLLELSPWWKQVGIEVDVGLTSDNAALLSLLRRQLQMDHVCVVRDHANLHLFVKQHPKDSLKTIFSCNLHAEPGKMKYPPDDSLVAFVGRAITLPFGKYTILAFSSEVRAPLTPLALDILEQIESMICDRYRVYWDEAAKVTYETITTSAVLLSPLQTYLKIANRMAEGIRSALAKMTIMLHKVENYKLYSCSASNALEYYCKRLQVVVENINTATDRLSTVARRYSEPDTKKYYLSCFQYRSEGFVDQVNEMLLEVSKLIPDHHLSWTFHLDAEVVDNSSGHRTFYQHLFFFLEGILLRWSDCCSSAHLSVSFDCEHSFHSSVDSQNRLELGYLMVRFQPEHVSQNNEEVEVAKSRSRQLVEMLGDFLRLTDYGARVEVVQAEKSSGVGRVVGEGEGESVEAESYLIRLPCHFHLVLDSQLGRSNSRVLYPSALGCSSVDSYSGAHREVEASKDEWLDDETSSNAPTESLVYSRSQFLKSKVFCRSFSVHRDIATRKRSVVCEDGVTAFTVSSISGLRSSLIIHHVSSTKESGLQHAPRTPRFAQRGRSISPVGKGLKASGNEADHHSTIEEEPGHQMEWMRQIVDISRSFMHKLMNRSSFIFSNPSLDRSDSSSSPRQWRPKIAPINTKSSFSAATTGLTSSP